MSQKELQVHAANDELLTFNEYNELGQLKNKKVGGNATTPIQTVDYKYNIRGWMTQINDLTNLGTDLFGYNINYNTLNTNFSGTAKYNGNIAQTTWKTNYSGADTKTRNYSYVYDRLNRLLDAKYTALGTTNDQDYYNENLTYDVNGNITTLKRYSNPASGTTAQKIDDLVYNYENAGYSNKLNKITLPAGEVNNSLGYNALQNAISYDANGNMINQLDKNISAISYNYLNLPYQITQTGGNTNYVYRADGLKVKKTYGTKVTDYLDGFQYENAVLQFIPTAEGYYDFANSRYTYNYTDHLGNVRLSYYKNSSGNLIIDKETNYYPFGLEHTGYNNLIGNQAYKYSYQHQEKQENTGWLSFKWRNYDPSMGRFFNVDPIAEDYPHNSTYAFSENRVIDNVELEGLEGEDFRFRLNQKLKGGIQEKVEIYSQQQASEAFLPVIQTLTPIEDFYSFYIGKDFNGNTVSKEQSAMMIALTLFPEVKVEAKAAVKTLVKTEAKIEAKMESKVLAKEEAKLGSVPKPEKGRGSVPPNERDPKRVYNKSEKQKMLDKQNGKCVGCGEGKTVNEVDGHHILRHADGGKTTIDNGAALCKSCHKEIHK